jgi:hypothetical protein
MYTKIPGSYTVDIIRASDFCIVTSPAFMLYKPDSAHIFTDDSLQFCLGDSIRLFTYYNSDYHYSWYRNGNMLSVADTNILYVNDQATYSVIIADPDSCNLIPVTVNTMLSFCTLISNEQHDGKRFVAYPSPVNDNLYFIYSESNDMYEEKLINITDISGRIVYSINTSLSLNDLSINTGSLIPGVYFINVCIKNTTLRTRFVKN